MKCASTRTNAWQSKLDTVGWPGRQCAVMAHARMEVTQPRHPLVVALVGGVVIVLGAKNGTVSRLELRAVAR